MTFNRYLKLSLGLRYSQVNGLSDNVVSSTGGDVWDRSSALSLRRSRISTFCIVHHYTSLRGAADLLEDRVTPVGPTREKQVEAGMKTEWFDNRLRFNATYFHILNNNLTYALLNESGQNTGYYMKAGNLKRKGVELELTGRLLKNLDVVGGYSYLDAAYHDSPYYHENLPMVRPNLPTAG